jgi:hypothetical protein
MPDRRLRIEHREEEIMNAPFSPDTIAIPQEFSACFAAQRAAYPGPIQQVT